MDFVMDDSSLPGEVPIAIPSGNSYPLAVQGLNSSLAPLTSGSNHSIGFGGPFPSHHVSSLHHEPPLDWQGTGMPTAESVTTQHFGGNIEEPPFQDGLVITDGFHNMLDTEAATSSPRSQFGFHPARDAGTPNNAFAASEFRDTGHVATFPLMSPPAPPAPRAPPVLPIPADMNASSGTRRTEQEWASHHNIIRKLYIEDNLTLASTMKIMKTRHGFNASSKRYKEKLKQWGLDKNLTRKQSRFIQRKTLQRRNEGKKTEFLIRKSLVPQQKIERHLKTAESTFESPTGKRGEHENAHETFLVALDGLETLLGPTHPSTIEALAAFVHFCSSQGFFDEAKDRMQKSLAGHQTRLGEHHQKTLRAMARLGHFCKLRGQYIDSEILLVKAKIGLERLYKLDPEELYLNTRDTATDLFDIFELQSDSDRAEEECTSLISKLEVLGEPYQQPLKVAKHNLVHLYANWLRREPKFWFRKGPPQRPGFLERRAPRQKFERLLLEAIEISEQSPTTTARHLCEFELLRHQYHSLNEDVKLESLLKSIVDRIGVVHRSGRQHCIVDDDDEDGEDKLLKLKSGLARSYAKLGNHQQAEWWFLRLQSEIESMRGVENQMAFDNIMHTALFYLDHDAWDEAKPLFLEAQVRAEKVLEPDNSIKSRIATCLVEQRYGPRCDECGY